MKYLEIAFIWTLYCALHSYMISTGFSKLMIRKLGRYYAFYRLFYVIISVVLLIPVIKFTAQYDHGIILHYGLFLNIVRYVLTGISLLIIFWAFLFSYDSLSFVGIRQIMKFGKGSKDPAGEIKQSGLLGIVRHPMYLGVIIILWCNTFTITDIVVNVVLTLYIFIGTFLEERKLVLEFGDIYVKYQQQVPMIIPFIKMKSG